MKKLWSSSLSTSSVGLMKVNWLSWTRPWVLTNWYRYVERIVLKKSDTSSFYCNTENDYKNRKTSFSPLSCIRVAVLTLRDRASQPSSPLSAQFPWTLNSPPTLRSLHQLHKLSSPQSWPQWVHKVRGLEPLEQHSPVGRQVLGWDLGWCDHRALSSGCPPTSCGYSYSRGCRVHSRWGRVSVLREHADLDFSHRVLLW